MKIENLKKRGWTNKEIARAKRTLKRGEEQNSTWLIFTHTLAFFSAIILALLGNFFSSILLVPVLLLVDGIYLVALLILFGMCFGTIFETIIWLFEKSTKHIIIAGLFIPVVALINVFMMVNLSNKFADALYTSVGHQNPVIVSGIYIGAFILPFLIHKLSILSKNSPASSNN